MPKRTHDDESLKPDLSGAFHTIKFDSCLLILQSHPILYTSSPSIKLREKDGAVWEAFFTNEESQNLYDDINSMHDIDIEQIIKHSRLTVETFKTQCHPSRVCSFALAVTTRQDPIGRSKLFNKNVFSAIADGTCAPELVAMDKHSKDEMCVDFFVKYKHIKRDDEDFDMTCHVSIRLTFLRVPEFE